MELRLRDILLLLVALLLLAAVLAAALLIHTDRQAGPTAAPATSGPTSTATRPPTGTPPAVPPPSGTPPSGTPPSGASPAGPDAPPTPRASHTPGTPPSTPGNAAPTETTVVATRIQTATLEPATLLADAHRARRNGDYATARAELDRVAATSTDPREITAAQYQAAILAYLDGDLPAARDRLQTFIAGHPDDHRVPAAHFYLAETLALLGDYPPALESYAAYLARQDVLADLVYARIARIHRFTGDPTAAAAAYAQAAARAPDLAAELDMREQQALALQAAGDHPAAQTEFQAILDRSENPHRLARIWYRIGGNHRLMGNEQAALDAFAQAIAGDPRPGHAFLALVELVNAGVQVDEYRRGLIDHHAGSHQAAIDALNRYLDATPAADAPDRAIDARYYAARSWIALGEPTRAMQHIERALDRAGPQAHTATHWGDLWLLKAETQAAQGHTDRAIATCLQFARTNPEHPLAPQAHWQAALLLQQAQRHAEAADRYNTLADHYPAADLAPQARFQAGLWRYWIGDLDAALAAWQKLAQTHPDTDAGQQGRYWLGKTLWATGSIPEARAELQELARRHPRTYYGLRAAHLLARDGQAPVWSHAPRPAHLTASETEEHQAVIDWLRTWADLSAYEPDRQVSSQLSGDLRFRRAVEMHTLGLRDQARDELETLRKQLHDPLSLYQLALVARDLELYAPSLRAVTDLTILALEASPADTPSAADATSADMPRLIRRLAYPAYYPDLVLAESAAHALDPLLLFALVRQESLFDDQVASWAGAVGLAQIMPATGQWIAEMTAWPQYDESLLRRPYLNLKFGAWFLDRILDQADGDVFTALAGYNGGPGLALQWQQQARGDPDLLLEIIPKSETQRYLRAIYRHYDTYLRLYGDGDWGLGN